MNVTSPRMPCNVAPDDAMFERLSRHPFRALLARCSVATTAAVFSMSVVLSLLIGLMAIVPAGLNSWVSPGDLLSLPLVALLIGFIAALIGIVPALVICVPLWAMLLRWRSGDWLSFACVGAAPGLALLAWEAEMGIAFLLYGIPCSATVWWLVRRWSRSDQV